MRSLKIINIYDVVNALAAMSSDILGYSILQLLCWLDCEILSFNFFLEFFSLTVANRRFLEAILNLVGIFWFLTCNSSSLIVQSILEFVAQVEIITLSVDFMGLIWRNVWSLGLEVVVVVSLASVYILLLFGSLLRSKSKADCHDSVWIGRIASSRILIDLWWFLVWVHLGGEDCLMRARFLIGCVFSFLSDLICRCLHDFVHAQIQIDVVLVNCQRVAMVNARKRLVIIQIWSAFGGGQMCFGALIIIELDVPILAELDCFSLDHHILLPKLIWLGTFSYIDWRCSLRLSLIWTHLIRAAFIHGFLVDSLEFSLSSSWTVGLDFGLLLAWSVPHLLAGLGSRSNWLPTAIIGLPRVNAALLLGEYAGISNLSVKRWRSFAN